MSLKPHKQTKMLTEEQVIQFRKLFYEEEWSYDQIEEAYGIPFHSLRRTIKGYGKVYASIKDDIPEELKKRRMPYRMRSLESKHWQENESKASAARYRREAEEREAKQKAKQEEERRKLIERLIREDQLKKQNK